MFCTFVLNINNMEEDYSIIRELDLTEEQVHQIVLEWYTYMCPDILQNEDGDDLEEYLETMLC